MLRQATAQDLPAIVHVHCICFANSFYSQLSHYQSSIWGGGLLLFRVYERLFRTVCGGR